jgi:hypothetical protein
MNTHSYCSYVILFLASFKRSCVLLYRQWGHTALLCNNARKRNARDNVLVFGCVNGKRVQNIQARILKIIEKKTYNHYINTHTYINIYLHTLVQVFICVPFDVEYIIHRCRLTAAPVLGPFKGP